MCANTPKGYGSSPTEWATNRYIPARDRYSKMEYKRSKCSGLIMPSISLGLWQNFDDLESYETARSMIFQAFDNGIISFDLANNYGRPPGSAETTLGRILREDLNNYRREMIISTKAGFDMWPGPYGKGGSKKYLISSLDESLLRLGLDYVDIFYSHCYDPEVPLEETARALELIVRSGRAIYIGICSYPLDAMNKLTCLLYELDLQCSIIQHSYSMVSRWAEIDIIPQAKSCGIHTMGFSILAQGMLANETNKKRQNQIDNSIDLKRYLPEFYVVKETLARLASERGQSLAELSLAWSLRAGGADSAVVGISNASQITSNISALENLIFTPEEENIINNIAKNVYLDPWNPIAENLLDSTLLS